MSGGYGFTVTGEPVGDESLTNGLAPSHGGNGSTQIGNVPHETNGTAPSSPLREALDLVYGNRMQRYGHPADVYARVGRIWGAILGIPDIPAEKVILMLQGMKLGREAENPDDDNPRDGAGYWEAYALTLARGK